MQVQNKKQNIPSGWQEKELGDVCDIVNGSTPKRAVSEYWENGNIPWFTVDDIRSNGRIINKTNQSITDKALKETSVKLLPEDSVLLCCTASLGEVALTKIPLTTNQQFNGLVSKDKKNIFPYYLFYSAQKLGESLKNKSGKTTINFLSVGSLSKEKVLVPPIKEQQKIAEILGVVDENITKTQEVMEATEKLKRGLMQQLFTRGIGHTKFKETKIGQIPEEWGVVSIRNSAIKLIDGDRGANYPKQEDFSPEGHCLFLSAKNVSKNGFIFDEVSFLSEEKDKALRKGKLERGDIILTSRGTVGNVAYYDEKIPFDNIRINSGMLIVRHGEQFDPVFLYRYFSSPQMEAKYSSMGSGSAQPQLPIGSLEQVEVPLIPVKEQKEIANIISAVNEKILINKKLKEKLTQLKKGLMSDLLSGKVRIK